MTDEPLKVEQPLLESSREMDELVYDQSNHSLDTQITVLGTRFPVQEF